VNFTVTRLAVARGGHAALTPDASWGTFVAQIGAPANEVVVVTQGDGPPPAPAGATVEGIDVVEATARPVAPYQPLHRPDPDGVYAHRWFDIADDDWPEFLSLSERAWPAFEDANPGTRIVGFFRHATATSPTRVLLITRYAGLAGWERSRQDTNSDEFRRRRDLTLASIVRTYKLL
jgi:hypothetical protein